MSFEYDLQQMIMVEAPAAVLDEAAVGEEAWGGRCAAFPLDAAPVMLLRPVGRRPARWAHAHGALRDVEQHLNDDERIAGYRRVWVVLVERQAPSHAGAAAQPLRPLRHRGYELTPEQERVLSARSLHGQWDAGHFACFAYGSPEAAHDALREAGATNTVTNAQGAEIDFYQAMAEMDGDLIEELHNTMQAVSKQEFFNEYCIAHREKYSEEFAWNRESPSGVRPA
jgi:hypothetical protein